MEIDKRSEFTASQALTAGTTVLTDYYNAGGDFDLGVGRPLYWNLVTLTEANEDASETYTFNLYSDSDPAFGTESLIASIVVPAGSPAGSKFSVGFPLSNQQYLRAKGVLADGGGTAEVTVESWMSNEPCTKTQAYAQNIPA